MKHKDFKEFEAMRAGVDYRFKVTCRKWEGMLRPLSCMEIMQSAARTSEAFDRLPDSQKNQITASLMNAIHQLEMASSTDVGEPPTLQPALLNLMSPDEINHLWKQYVRVIDKVNPSFEEMTKEELDELVDRLKKNSDVSSILIDLSISNLVAVCRRLLTETTA